MVGIDADDVGTNPTITLEGVRDSIVSSRTMLHGGDHEVPTVVWGKQAKLVDS